MVQSSLYGKGHQLHIDTMPIATLQRKQQRQYITSAPPMKPPIVPITTETSVTDNITTENTTNKVCTEKDTIKIIEEEPTRTPTTASKLESYAARKKEKVSRQRKASKIARRKRKEQQQQEYHKIKMKIQGGLNPKCAELQHELTALERQNPPVKKRWEQ